jgi:hypothetical protein
MPLKNGLGPGIAISMHMIVRELGGSGFGIYL